MKRAFRRLANLYKVLWLADDLENVRGELNRRISELRDEVYALKSSLDVSPELIDEFLEWKANNAIPVEPLVTVTVVTYNRARLLVERCIPSILNQTYEKLELIVVGDCCTDETESLLSKIKDPRLRFYNLPERAEYPLHPVRRWMVAGMPAADKAFSLVRGDYLTHLDDDDEYMPERLEKLVRFAVENQCDFVWHPFWWERHDGRWLLNEAQELAYTQITNASVFYRSWFAKIGCDANSHLLMEPGDWNRYRRIKYLGPAAMRYPEPLLKHYRERGQATTALDEPAPAFTS